MKGTPPHNLTTSDARYYARSMRSEMTEEERILWSELKRFRQKGWAFRKQAATGPFVADFLCRKAMLVVEVDGRGHDDESVANYDARRSRWLESHGYRVVRIPAADVWRELGAVVDHIEHLLNDA